MGIRTVGFHEGELVVQRRAGVEADAARLVATTGDPNLGERVVRFLAGNEFAVLTARGGDGRLWTVPLTGPPGFLGVQGFTLSIAGAPDGAGPLGRLPAGQDVGMIAIEFASRRRLRVNGRLSTAGPRGLEIEVEQAFGNCPSYIQGRTIAASAAGPPSTSATGSALTGAQRDLIGRSDTFFLGTTHPGRGADVSHKGGRPGFVRVDDDRLWWPDYAGNNMFNSLGNIAVDDAAALLFLDFTSGVALHVSGRAELEWRPPGGFGDDGGTGRKVVLRIERVTEHAVPFTASLAEPAEGLPDLA